MAKPILLLTATISPGGMINTARADPAQRTADYLAALTKWVDDGPCDHLVLCESSSAPESIFAGLQERARQRGRILEYHSFQQDFPPHLGKGYGESGIMGHALAHSPALQSASVILKATGRYWVANAGKLLEQAVAEPAAIICDLRAYLTEADCRWFAVTPHFLRTYLLPRREQCNDSTGVFMEHVLAQAIHAAMADGLRWRLPRTLSQVEGIGGTRQKRIRTSVSKHLRHAVKRSVIAY